QVQAGALVLGAHAETHRALYREPGRQRGQERELADGDHRLELHAQLGEPVGIRKHRHARAGSGRGILGKSYFAWLTLLLLPRTLMAGFFFFGSSVSFQVPTLSFPSTLMDCALSTVTVFLFPNTSTLGLPSASLRSFLLPFTVTRAQFLW